MVIAALSSVVIIITVLATFLVIIEPSSWVYVYGLVFILVNLSLLAWLFLGGWGK